jgi:hypothetical protein
MKSAPSFPPLHRSSLDLLRFSAAVLVAAFAALLLVLSIHLSPF